MGHDWVFDVLRDLRDYARANGLHGLAMKAEEALQIATEEIGRQAGFAVGEPPEGVSSH